MSKAITHKRRGRLPSIEVVDLFCGIGGLSYGMKSKGLKILAGFDLDQTCQYAYETNNEAKFYFRDIKTVTAEDIKPLYSKRAIKVLAGCAPCQPFSSYAFKNKRKDSNKYDLLYEFGRLVKEVQPDIVTMENVSSILFFDLKSVFPDFIKLLRAENYHISYQFVYCPDYGIPQTRKRLVLLASKIGDISLIPPTHNKSQYVTLREAIGDLPFLNAGEICPTDPLHRCRARQGVNAKEYFEAHFRDILGKAFTPYVDEEIYSLALDKSDETNNLALLSELRQYFFVEECHLGENPNEVLGTATAGTQAVVSLPNKDGVLMVMMENYDAKCCNFLSNGKIAIGIKYTLDTMEIVENIGSISYILFHHRSTNGQHLFRLKGDCVVKPDTEVESDRYRNVSTTQMYILADIEPAELDSSRLRSIAKPYTPQTRYDAQFARLEELMKTI